MQKEDVIEFIESVKKPEIFLKYCEKFHQEEPRDIAYVVSRSIVSKDPNNISFILAGAKIIIITLNAARFLRLSSKVKANLENNILEAYKNSSEELKELERKSLEHLRLDELKDKIKSVFHEFSSKQSIGFTGTSKILHILNPHVFMMWDTDIRNAYHKLHAKNHKIGDAECYFEFLKQSQEIEKALLSKESEENLWKKHLSSLDEKFMSAFLFKENILKMLDECNYVRFKLNIKL